MSFDTLVSAAQLRAALQDHRPLVVLDCGFDLNDPAAGRRAHAAGHVPGAHYADLDEDLTGPASGSNGRHPLPDRLRLAARAGAWGIEPGTQVVCYDAQGGPYAARAWWLLRWLGHAPVGVLDGGLAAWRAAGGELETATPPERAGAPYPAAPAPAMPTIGADALLAQLGALRLVDARAGERFRGEVEPLDPVAGHIPGASQRFFKDNLQPDGRFKPPAQLQREFAALGLDTAAGATVVQHCGSGVTACHNLLAMAHAGFGDTWLYPGSWSEWCADPSRPIARG